MVEVIDPQKHESILDTACGTAGFLISAWKHILKQNTTPSPLAKEGLGEGAAQRAGDQLTPAERARLAANIHGYDISPDMVRLSLVNLYLHGFTDPHIVEYDTLTSEERWNETADVILANPPFMSPKGGIKPHKRFSIQAKRSEVLFVDYMAEHLSPTGRAAIIVPEGIIFQSQTAYRQLRELLLKTSLVAVVSLPAGCFNPYSGVKTSILILDKAVARRSNTLAFFKVENDGYGLGAQRRAIDRNDLPQVKAELADYLHRLRSGESVLSPPPQPGEGPGERGDFQPTCGLIVPKEKIAANGDYNLSGERYREGVTSNHSFPLVSLGDESLFRVESGGTPKSNIDEYWGGGIPWATLVDLPATDFISEITETKRTISDKGLRESSAKLIPENSVVVSTRATIGRIAINRIPIATNQGFKNVVIEDLERTVPEFVALALTKLVPTMKAWATGGTFAEISKSKFCELQIPLPPLEVQTEIVAEIEGYQKVINGARAVLDHYRPHIPIHPDWPMVALGDACIVNPRKSEVADIEGSTVVSFVPMSDIGEHEMFFAPKDTKRLDEVTTSYTYFKNGDVLLAKVTPCFENGKAGIARDLRNGIGFGSSEFYVLRPTDDLLPQWVFMFAATPAFRAWATPQMTGTGGLQRVPRSVVEGYPIPLPPLATQRAIVAEIEAEQALVNANRDLVARMEKKIQATLSRVWGDDEPSPAEA